MKYFLIFAVFVTATITAALNPHFAPLVIIAFLILTWQILVFFEKIESYFDKKQDKRNYEDSRERVVSEFLRKGGWNG